MLAFPEVDDHNIHFTYILFSTPPYFFTMRFVKLLAILSQMLSKSDSLVTSYVFLGAHFQGAPWGSLWTGCSLGQLSNWLFCNSFLNLTLRFGDPQIFFLLIHLVISLDS